MVKRRTGIKTFPTALPMMLRTLLVLFFRPFSVGERQFVPEGTAALPSSAALCYGVESAANDTLAISTNRLPPATEGAGVFQQRANKLVVLKRRGLRLTKLERPSRHYRFIDVLEDYKSPGGG